jgi:hypothetical protein
LATGVDEDAIVAVPFKEPRQDASDGAVVAIVVDAAEKTSAGPLEGWASPVTLTEIELGAVKALGTRAGPVGHQETVCSGTHNCGASPMTVTSPPMTSVPVLSASETLNRGDNPLVCTFNEDKSTVLFAPVMGIRFQPLRTAPDALKTVSDADEYALDAGDVNLNDLHC